MTQERLQELLVSTGALQHGHFVLDEGRHTDVLLRPLKVLQFPPHCRKVAFEIVQHYLDMDVQLVIAANPNAVLFAAEIARQLEARIVFSVASDTSNTAVLHRDFAIHSGDRAIMVDNILTNEPTAMRALGRKILMADARLIGIASLFDTSTAAHVFNVRQITALKVIPQFWSSEECPLCGAEPPQTSPKSNG